MTVESFLFWSMVASHSALALYASIGSAKRLMTHLKEIEETMDLNKSTVDAIEKELEQA